MFARTVCLAFLLTLSAWIQAATPPKPKVVSIPPPRAKPVNPPAVKKKPTPTPKPAPALTGAVAPIPAPTLAPAPKPTPPPAPKPRKKPAVAEKPAEKPAEATPKPAPRKPAARPEALLTAYMPSVKAAFSERWGDAVTPLMKDFAQGNVSVLFKLDAAGAVSDFQVTQNTSNEAFAKFCEQFVRETPFEKPPEKALTAGHVEIPFTFWIY
jgi:TonB family protein